MNKLKTQKTIVLGVDVGGSHISCAAVDMDSGELISETKVDQKIDPFAERETILKLWVRTLKKGLERIPLDQFGGIGIALPGPFDYGQGICLMKGVGKYESLYGVNVKEFLQGELGPYGDFLIIFENDASCFALGEHWQGAAKKRKRVLGITLGTGMGSTFLKDGAIQKKGTGVPRYGFLYYLPWCETTADDYFSSRGLIGRAAEICRNEFSGVKEMAELAGSDAGLQKLFAEFGEELADFLAACLKEVKADILVLGGNITRAWPWFGFSLEEELMSNEVICRVEVSQLWDDAAIYGASRMVEKEIIEL